MAPSPATLYAEQSPTQEQNIKICNTCYQRLPTTEFEKANHGTSLRGPCNTALGILEKVDWVKKAKAYLAKYRRKDESGNDQPSLFDAL